MRQWAANHPKAKLMARKRAAILDAARDIFLRFGYEGASMEGIAAAAGVSIMTLYRHAASKNDLFAAVITSACAYSEETRQAEQARLMPQPLEDVLIYVGLTFQEKLLNPETIALLRTVIAESTRFPQLAETAHSGLIAAYENNLDDFLTQREEASGTSASVRHKLCTAFLDRLIGQEVLRALLGLGINSVEERRERVRHAARIFLSDLSSVDTGARTG